MDILILDNGGKTDDRYTVIFDDREVYTVTASPAAPKYLCEAVDLNWNEASKPIAFADLPKQRMKTIQRKGSPWLRKRAA
jgi:hypothetical protein